MPSKHEKQVLETMFIDKSIVGSGSSDLPGFDPEMTSEGSAQLVDATASAEDNPSGCAPSAAPSQMNSLDAPGPMAASDHVQERADGVLRQAADAVAGAARDAGAWDITSFVDSEEGPNGDRPSARLDEVHTSMRNDCTNESVDHGRSDNTHEDGGSNETRARGSRAAVTVSAAAAGEHRPTRPSAPGADDSSPHAGLRRTLNPGRVARVSDEDGLLRNSSRSVVITVFDKETLPMATMRDIEAFLEAELACVKIADDFQVDARGVHYAPKSGKETDTIARRPFTPMSMLSPSALMIQRRSPSPRMIASRVRRVVAIRQSSSVRRYVSS